MMQLDVWREGLFGMIEEFADSDKLRRHWSGKVPRVARSFVEDVAMLYDDFELDQFIGLGAVNTKLTDQQYDALRAFRDAFESLLESLRPDGGVRAPHPSVLNDPHWLLVVDAAAQFVQLREGANH